MKQNVETQDGTVVVVFYVLIVAISVGLLVDAFVFSCAIGIALGL